MHPDFLSIVRLIKSKNIIPLVACTGINLSDDTIQSIVTAGIPTLQISLDGATSSTHNLIRQADNFDEVCGAAKRIVAAGLNLNIALCIHKTNANEICQLLDLCLKLNAFSVKLTFYVEFSSTPSCRQLNSTEIFQVLKQAQIFSSRHKKADWIICPGYDVNTCSLLEPIRTTPDIVIFANGDVSTDETQPAFGNIYETGLAELYTQHTNNLIRNFFHRITSYLSKNYDVESIETTASEIGANAIIYKQEEKFHIILDESLSEVIRFFTTLHEIGHIATQTLSYNPRYFNDSRREFAANEWALLQIKPYIHPEIFYHYENALLDSENTLYRLIEEKLSYHLVNFF